MSERGSVSLVVLGCVGIVVAAGILIGAVGQVALVLNRAHTAADAAALAAAPVTFRAFGAGGGPAAEASRFAASNGARLVRCSCRIDRSWADRTVEVVVAVESAVLIFGRREIRAAARAEFSPVDLLR